jgi:hypothetical protein
MYDLRDIISQQTSLRPSAFGQQSPESSAQKVYAEHEAVCWAKMNGVGPSDCSTAGTRIGPNLRIGTDTGRWMGLLVGDGVRGALVGFLVGGRVGCLWGGRVGCLVGAFVGAFMGAFVGAFVGATVGRFTIGGGIDDGLALGESVSC